MTSKPPKKQNVFVMGEAELVREFGLICTRASLGVVCPPARPKTVPPLPGDFRTSASIPKTVLVAVELTNTNIEMKKKNLVRLDRALPAGIPIISSSVTVSAGTQASWLKHPERLVGFGGFPTLMEAPLTEIAVPAGTVRAILGEVGNFFISLGKEISVVQDRVGLVMPRILCSIINEACFALTEEVASPRDIDTAMKLGTNYPRGPLEWANLAGIAQVIAVLEALRDDTGEERYRTAPLLKLMSSSTDLLK